MGSGSVSKLNHYPKGGVGPPFWRRACLRVLRLLKSRLLEFVHYRSRRAAPWAAAGPRPSFFTPVKSRSAQNVLAVGRQRRIIMPVGSLGITDSQHMPSTRQSWRSPPADTSALLQA